MKALPMALCAALTLSLASVAPTTAWADGRHDGPTGHGNAAFSFGLIADPQYWSGPAQGTRYYADSLQKLAESAATINDAKVSFTVQLGDMVDRDPKSFDEILPIFERIHGPRYSVLGNHDFPGISSDEAVERLSMPNEYYDFTHQNWRFVVLDNNDVSLYANAPGSADYVKAQEIIDELREQGAINAQTYNGALGDEQMAWLKATLADADEKGQQVIVIGHMPLAGGETEDALDAPVIRQVLESYPNVVAYLNGHYHPGAYQVVDGIHYVTMKGMVEQPYPANAYSVVTVQQNKVRIDGFGLQQDLVLDARTH
ncbi:metallophosphoesterase [Nonomuraea sp. K274]|uniref:Metallophosphoesterase n=1 Tax=Nonomuraea cypriaca TaxID=1187855 RepID=A0A931A3Z5_9ACTN|nr:metallophosphoesterase [Nonomuraea cypriaca]MBF8184374.1 metallophosphoesterase [Nonomuraea cypriaca]